MYACKYSAAAEQHTRVHGRYTRTQARGATPELRRITAVCVRGVVERSACRSLVDSPMLVWRQEAAKEVNQATKANAAQAASRHQLSLYSYLQL